LTLRVSPVNLFRTRPRLINRTSRSLLHSSSDESRLTRTISPATASLRCAIEHVTNFRKSAAYPFIIRRNTHARNPSPRCRPKGLAPCYLCPLDDLQADELRNQEILSEICMCLCSRATVTSLRYPPLLFVTSRPFSRRLYQVVGSRRRAKWNGLYGPNMTLQSLGKVTKHKK
jgi:hypothetical protein